MNALVRKEIRLVLPAWAGAMALAILPVWIFWPGVGGSVFSPPGMVVFGLFALGALVLGLTSFGQELNLGTFSALLAQPVSRRRLWLCKTTIAATALGLALVALYLSVQFRVDSVIEGMKSTVWRTLIERPAGTTSLTDLIASTRHSALEGALLIGGVAVMAAFSGGLWTTMLFRQTSAAFWFTLLIPTGLGMLTEKIFGAASAGFAAAGFLATLGLYSVAGFFWAKRQFLLVQDTQWTGGVIALPAWPFAKAAGEAGAGHRQRRPIRALVRKEFQLQHVNLIIAGLLLLTHLADLVVRKLGAGYFVDHRSVGMIWESWPLLWLVMPLLIGGVSVAEERKMGTMEGFLCLPATRRREFLLKLAMVMFLGFALGGVMPVLLEKLGAAIGLPRNDSGVTFSFGWQTASFSAVALLSSAGLAAISFYASTLTRNLLQALGLGVLLAVLSCGLIGLTNAVNLAPFDRLPLWRGPLVGWIMLPVMLATGGRLAFGNFKQAQVSAKVWSRNILALVAALVCSAAVTTVVYHRTWELWLPTEPVQGWHQRELMSAQTIERFAERDPSIRNRFIPPKLEASGACVAVLTHDGRLWLRQRQVHEVEVNNGGHPFRATVPFGSWQSGFVEGSNWRDMAVTMKHTFAIQADGSLWDLSEIQFDRNTRGSEPRRVGSSSDWRHIASSRQSEFVARHEHFTALKSDGTLWEWGDLFVHDGEKVGIRKIAEPTQVGHDTDWTAVSDSQRMRVALKSDGSVWRWGEWYRHTNQTWSVVVEPERWLTLPGPQPATLSSGPYQSTVMAVCADGSLWTGGDLPDGLVDHASAARAHGEMVRCFGDTTWSQVELVWMGSGIAVARDGSLWQWNIENFMPDRIGGMMAPVRASRDSRWIAVSPYGNAFLALANDGSVCLWGDPQGELYYRPDGPEPNRLLLPTRIKATVFAKIWE